jgi:hypothetical protein
VHEYVKNAKNIIKDVSWVRFNLKYFNFFKNIEQISPPKIPKPVEIIKRRRNDPNIDKTV